MLPPNKEKCGLWPQSKLENHEEFYFGDYSCEVPLAFVFFFSSWLITYYMPKACTAGSFSEKA